MYHSAALFSASAWWPMVYGNFTVESDRLHLKTISEASAAEVLAFLQRNREFFRPWEPMRTEEYFTLPRQQELLADDALAIASGTKLKLWLSLKTSAAIVGYVHFSNIVRGAFQSCFLSYALDKEENGKGYMTEALMTATRILFHYEGLHRIEANVMPGNARSIRLLERAGFHNEGMSKRYLKINGVWEDHTHMVLLNE